MSTAAETMTAQAGADEDWWVNNNKKDTFVEIPSIINGVTKKTRWWTSFWYNQPPKYTGYYVWGGSGSKPDFDSIFDPAQSVVQQGDGVQVKVKRNGNDAPYTAELVLEGLIPGDSNSHPGLGYYAVTAVGRDLGSLDPNVVLGIFTYQYGASNSGSNRHREMDLLETIAGVQQTGDQNNAQVAVQPASGDRQHGLVGGRRFTIPRGMQVITAFMRWTGSPNSLSISLRVYAGQPSMADMIADSDGSKALPNSSWIEPPSPRVPLHKNERMHINFYVPGGRQGNGLPKTDQQVTITQFQYKSP